VNTFPVPAYLVCLSKGAVKLACVNVLLVKFFGYNYIFHLLFHN